MFHEFTFCSNGMADLLILHVVVFSFVMKHDVQKCSMMFNDLTHNQTILNIM